MNIDFNSNDDARNFSRRTLAAVGRVFPRSVGKTLFNKPAAGALPLTFETVWSKVNAIVGLSFCRTHSDSTDHPNVELRKRSKLLVCVCTGLLLLPILAAEICIAEEPSLTQSELKKVLDFQQQRVSAIDRVINSVVAIYDDDRGGGGSGVVITPTGIALTNHHVIIGAGVEGWGGMAGNKMFRWKLIGTDPGGDVSLIQMMPNDQASGDFEFPFTPLGNSDDVQVGDWALAMGNPFILTEDQSPTVTLGIVSGVKRYQSGAGQNQLVYGNCIQVDSSINPGNSGGPLFNTFGEVIGINGRGSFQDRGRVNVGLGYAISSNQIKNFIPELLATKLVEHGTLDANFSDRGDKVVCSTLSVDSPATAAGLALGDQMIAFEGEQIETANHFTNLICTLPEGWPARLKVRKSDGSEIAMRVRLLGLPYARPAKPKAPNRKKKRGKDGSETPPTEQEKAEQRKIEMAKLLSSEPGIVRDRSLNAVYVTQMLDPWQQPFIDTSRERCWSFEDVVTDEQGRTSKLVTWLCADGRFVVQDDTFRWRFDGEDFYHRDLAADDSSEEVMTFVEAKLRFETLQAMVMTAGFSDPAFSTMGDILIDGADLCDEQIAFRFVAADRDQDPLYFWMTGAISSKTPLQLRKCSADINALQSAVLLNDFQRIEGETFSLPLTRHEVRGLNETVLRTIKNVLISPIPIADFDELIANHSTKRAAQTSETNDQ